jgi:hypothetical protein
MDWNIHLDRRVILTGVYNPASGLTTWTLPYSDPSTDFAVVSSTGVLMSGTQKTSANTITKVGDFSAGQYYVGKNYTMRYQFSEWFIKLKADNIANIEGRLQMRSVKIGFKDTGYFKVIVTPFRRESLVQEYTSLVVGALVIGVPSVLTDEQSFMLLCNSKGSKVEIINDTYLPSEFHAASFKGFYTTNSQVI